MWQLFQPIIRLAIIQFLSLKTFSSSLFVQKVVKKNVLLISLEFSISISRAKQSQRFAKQCKTGQTRLKRIKWCFMVENGGELG